MEHFKKVLKALKFNNTEIENLLDETKVDEQTEIINGWDSRYSQVVGEKLKPIIETELKESNAQEIFNKQKEAIRKARKSINDTLGLGLSSKQLDEAEDEFKAILKEHSAKETDTKLKDIQSQYEEEKRLREDAEKKLVSEIEKVKTEFFQKDIDREIQLRKANKLASKDSTKFDKSDMELIEYAIEGAKINQGISFVTENGKVYVTKEGQKQRNQSNELIQYEDWLEPILSKFEIKQRKTPDAKLDEKGNPIEIKEDSEAVKRLKATYEAKGITVGATA